ncbi:Repeat domain-containing protein [Chitinophaga jiangningensis]|uniref:Repeat domain-containing protein n=1 Tax=Chitinophaga jiangningensis TaxID=1419482 RepID=A0A1M6WTM3_9BACT|nr:VCBS repeat-containing protein [Chitinophaga jiangningensis]SHK96991.1 Repeat domain-containing protein [Chitinophaga jiangningensis]
MSAQPMSIRKGLLYSSFVFASIIAITVGCHTPTRDEQAAALADKHCGSCHMPVSPALLDSVTWNDHVLPAMAQRVGIRVWNETSYYPPMPGDPAPAIPFKEWTEIVAYYQRNAPKKLKPAEVPVPLRHEWSGFQIGLPQVKDTSTRSTVLVAADSAGNIYTADAYDNTLTRWNPQLVLTGSWKTHSPVVDIAFRQSPQRQLLARITQIGDMRAVDKPSGIIADLNLEAGTTTDIKPYLQRPVQTIALDFDKDGREEMVTCAFGHHTGGLIYLRQQADGKYEERALMELPGATKAIPGDFNNDGWTDLMVLFAAGEEGIWLFENDKKGGFSSKNLIKFPPVYGSTSFQLADFNGDGKLDILYTCGDNADYSIVLKPYHGVYIYLNEGNNQYKQAWFYPVNGCTKAIAADFNQDGQLDIATIAFFADLEKNPGEKFILFQGNEKPLQFTPFAPPIEKEGHWMTMEAADIDKDGDLDILLGNYAKGFIVQEDYKPNWKEYQPFIVLFNTLR